MKQLPFDELAVFEKMLLELGVSPGIDYSYKILGDVRSTLLGHVHRNFFVDDFPDFSAAVSVIQKGEITQKAGSRFRNGYVTCYGKCHEKLKHLLLDISAEIQWDIHLVFCSSKYFEDVVQEFAAIKGYPLKIETHPVLEAKITNLPKFNLPDGYTLSTLTENEAQLIAQAWPYSTEETEAYICWLIKNFRSLAIQTDDGTLAAYMIQMENGTIGLLRVIPDHRRKGIAQFLVTELTRQTIKPGEVSYLYTRSEESYWLHTKCGYKKVMDTVWAFPKKR